MSTTFNGLGLRPDLVQALKQQHLTIATPVQQAAIPALLAGKDVIAQAQTGTGKTLAFVLPILEAINTQQPHIQALIITPTRELAIQITEEIKNLAQAVDARVLAAYGGQDVEGQIHKLKGAMHIVVGTPGRLLDHLRRGTLSLSQVKMLVLDEADQMLHMGFLDEVDDIIARISRERQTMLFSATMNDAVRRLASYYMRSPEDIQIEGKRVTLEGIEQIAVETTDRGKQPALCSLLTEHNPFLAIVFCRTKIRAKKLTATLIEQGFQADELHGDLSQAKRENVMKRFKAAKLQILVATDVAARGLDVEGVTHVFNYDIPHDGEDYIHRIGRTGRAGHEGVAVTFVTGKDRRKLQEINARVGHVIEFKVAQVTSRQKSDDHRKDRSANGGLRSKTNSAKSSRRGRIHETGICRKGKKTASVSGKAQPSGRSGRRSGPNPKSQTKGRKK